jgi:Ca2+-binding EF-hand superfamily protein
MLKAFEYLFACDKRFPEGRSGAAYWKGAQVLEPIVVWRVKDRMATRTSGGWADALINFSFFYDGNVHICEVQFAHQRLLTDRKEGGAHHGYAIFRAANEILDSIGKLPESELETEDESMTEGDGAATSLHFIKKEMEELQKQVAAMGQAQTELQLQNDSLKSKLTALNTAATADRKEGQIRQAFSVLDTDGLGALDCGEFKLALVSEGAPLSDSEVEAMFAAADSNKNGAIELDEFITWWRTAQHGRQLLLARSGVV